MNAQGRAASAAQSCGRTPRTASHPRMALLRRSRKQPLKLTSSSSDQQTRIPTALQPKGYFCWPCSNFLCSYSPLDSRLSAVGHLLGVVQVCTFRRYILPQFGHEVRDVLLCRLLLLFSIRGLFAGARLLDPLLPAALLPACLLWGCPSSGGRILQWCVAQALLGSLAMSLPNSSSRRCCCCCCNVWPISIAGARAMSGFLPLAFLLQEEG